MSRLKLPIGLSDFKTIIKENFVFCDKTEFIKEFIDLSHTVTLITRPRRWGKTLTLSMVKYFFDINEQETSGDLFKNLKIANVDGGVYIEKYQGQYPVIFLSLKDIDCESFHTVFKSFHLKIRQIIDQNSYLLSSKKVSETSSMLLKENFDKNADLSTVQMSLYTLSKCLFEHHGKGVVLLIDEYDTPLNEAVANESCLEIVIKFFKKIFSGVLKDNIYLKKALLFGILNISNNSIFSGLNNILTFTILDNEYSNHIGFTEPEVISLMKKASLENLINDAKYWYNGFKIGNCILYNPWSILSCITKRGSFKVYWINTSNNNLIEKTIISSDPSIKFKFIDLMSQKFTTVSIDENLRISNLTETNENAFWTLLFSGGYLSYNSLFYKNMKYNLEVKIPNYEIYSLYSKLFEDWFEKKFKNKIIYQTFIQDLIDCKIESFLKGLEEFLSTEASFFDICSENSYHVLILGMTVVLRDTHTVRSNRESGHGRYDLLIRPKEGSQAILFEFKASKIQENLRNDALLALNQIEQMNYSSDLRSYPNIKAVIEVGIAFFKKIVKGAYLKYDLETKKRSPTVLT